MACCSLSFPVAAKPKSPYSMPGAVAVSSPSFYHSSSRSSSQSQLSMSSRGFYSGSSPSLLWDETLTRGRFSRRLSNLKVVSSSYKPELMKVMISGAPASGKGTQCQLIKKKYGLVHVAAGDLLRAEISAGSENGKRAKEYMEKGLLVPDEIVVMMVKERLMQSDSQENGWLLDGYPRSLSQATALKEFGLEPDIFILLDVHEEKLVERVVGRRLDPITGRIYHLKHSPPETEEIASRLTQRFDDTEEKVKMRLDTHHQNVESVLSMYEDIIVKVNGNATQEDVFAQIDSALTKLVEQKKGAFGSVAA